MTKKMWRATGKLGVDGGTFEVKVYPEHRSKIKKAGYDVTWDVAGDITGDNVPVRLVESNGERRIGEVRILGTEDEWLEVWTK